MIPHARKLAGLNDLKMLSKAPDITKFASPADEVICRGVKVRIASLKQKQDTAASLEDQMTKEEIGLGNKKIIVPSFSTTSILFTRHFHILRDLRRRIDLLK